PDGGIQTACSEVCPAGAIVFGDINDKHSKASLMIAGRKGFRLLESLGTEPAVYYLI
ncbi:MAG: hypothetical protein QG635_1979, partial [Bacteroidota bacterium]|nr:hypothetical protein [Bacteroidota bacterium]